METPLHLALIIHIALSQENCLYIDGCTCTFTIDDSTIYNYYVCTNAAISEIPYFPYGTIHLDLSSNNIQILADDIFKNNNRLVELSLCNNKIETLPATVFAENTELKYFDLSSNTIKVLPVEIFFINTKLENLILHDNLIEILPEGIFAGKVELWQISLYDNNIEALPAEIFKTNIKLKELDLSGNMILYFPQDIFAANVNLKLLLLRRNKISILPENIFASNINLLTLDLSSNNIQNLTGDIFKNNNRLVELDLSGNMILYLPKDIFAANVNLKLLILRRNKISILPENIFSSNINLLTLFMDGNPIESFYGGIFDATNLGYALISFNCNCMRKKIYELILQESMNVAIKLTCEGFGLLPITDFENALCLDTDLMTLYQGMDDPAVECTCPENKSLDDVLNTQENEAIITYTLPNNAASEDDASLGRQRNNSSTSKSVIFGTSYVAFGSAVSAVCMTVTSVTVMVNIISNKDLMGKEIKIKRNQNEEDKNESTCIDIDMTEIIPLDSELGTRFFNNPPVNHVTVFN